MTNWRTLLLCAVAALLPALGSSAMAQTVTRPPRVVIIFVGTEESARLVKESLLDGMRQAGQVQGRTVQIDVPFGDRDPACVRALIHESVAETAAVLVVGGLIAARHARDATTTVPVVVATSSDLVDSGIAPGGQTADQIPPDQRATNVPLNPADPSFVRFINVHAVEIEVRNTDGRVVRKGAGVISSDSGYVMTSLDLVVGGTEYLIEGPAVGSGGSATALAVSKAGLIAILQLTGKAPSLSPPARSVSPPQAGDRVYTAVPPGQSEATLQPGKVSAVRTERDGAVVLELDLRTAAGAGVYNSRGALVGIVRGGDQARPSNQAVFVPERMPGDWVLYFPARVGDPLAKKPVSR